MNSAIKRDGGDNQCSCIVWVPKEKGTSIPLPWEPLRGPPSKLALGLRAVFLRSVPHTKSLESRIKEELIAQGLLESEDRPTEDSEDEVLAELRKRQAELKALSAHNRTKKHDLLR